jgi:glutathionyl-hydroquinone reductase
MDNEVQLIGDLAKILLPSALLLYAMYLTVKTFISKDFEKKLVEIRQKNIETVLPIRLQAYERMCLFLERISPHNLVVRVNDPSYNVAQLHQTLLREIREEYSHNMSQQIYMSDQSWTMVKNAMDQVVKIINNASENLSREARGIELAKAIFDRLMQLSEDPTAPALKFLKNEIQKVF